MSSTGSSELEPADWDRLTTAYAAVWSQQMPHGHLTPPTPFIHAYGRILSFFPHGQKNSSLEAAWRSCTMSGRSLDMWRPNASLTNP